MLHESVAEYIQILTLWTGELKPVLNITQAAEKFRAKPADPDYSAAVC